MFPSDPYNGTGYPQQYDPMGRPVGISYQSQIAGMQPAAQTQGRLNRGACLCCPVTSREEAVATRVEAFGPAIIMPDLGHGMIYYKRFNEKTALADFGEFRYVPSAQENQSTQQAPGINYAGLVSTFSSRLDDISGQLEQILQRFGAADEAKVDGKGVKK